MNLAEIKAQVQFVDAEASASTAVGTVQTIYDDCDIVAVVKNSKNGAKRCTIVLTNQEGKRTNLVMSEALSAEYRADNVSLAQIVLFPVFFKEDTKSFFVGLPTMGKVAVSSIQGEEYKPAKFSVADLMKASINGGTN